MTNRLKYIRQMKLSSFGFCLLTAGLWQQAKAQDFGLVAGLRQTTVDINGATVTGGTGLQMGALAKIQISGAFWTRLGFLYTQKYFSAKYANFTGDYKFTNLDIPITFMYKFSEYGGFFAGPVVSVNQSKSCDASIGGSCALDEVNSMTVPISFGVSFKFAPQIGMDLVYDYGPSSVAMAGNSAIKNMQSVGANLVLYFD